MRRESPLTVLEARTIRAEPPVSEYAAELVRGVQAHRDEIDRLLAENSRGWSLDRMPAVDRNILRIGGYELLCGTEVPPAVAISEAVLLAGDLSTHASPAFVNGLLAPPLMLLVMLVGNNRAIMGTRVNGVWLNVFGWGATAVMTLAMLAFLGTSF